MMNHPPSPKLAYYQGQARVLSAVGLSDTQIKMAAVAQGLSVQEAEGLMKEAGIGTMISKGLQWAGKGLSKAFGGGARAKALEGMKFKPLTEAGGAVVKGNQGARGMLSGGNSLKGFSGYQQGTKAIAPNMGERAGRAFSSAAKGMETAPGKTLWGGTKNFGKGMMFSPGAKGIGGALGKGFSGYQMGSMLLGSGNSPQPQPMQNPYRRY